MPLLLFCLAASNTSQFTLLLYSLHSHLPSKNIRHQPVLSSAIPRYFSPLLTYPSHAFLVFMPNFRKYEAQQPKQRQQKQQLPKKLSSLQSVYGRAPSPPLYPERKSVSIALEPGQSVGASYRENQDRSSGEDLARLGIVDSSCPNTGVPGLETGD